MNSGTSGNAYDTYNRDAAIAQHGKAREVTNDDIAASGNGGSAYGHYLLNQRTGERTENVIEGFNVVQDCNCGCPGKPSCAEYYLEQFKQQHPNREPFGWFEWVMTGGNVDGARYNRQGQCVGYALQMGTPPIPAIPSLGLINTGRTVAKNLKEMLTMEEIMANPQMGRVAMEKLGDPRLKGWVKMEYVKKLNDGRQIVIHYVAKFEEGIMKAIDDFKFINK